MKIDLENMGLIIQEELSEIEELLSEFFTLQDNRTQALHNIKGIILESFHKESAVILEKVAEHLMDYSNTQCELEGTLIMIEQLEQKLKQSEE